MNTATLTSFTVAGLLAAAALCLVLRRAPAAAAEIAVVPSLPLPHRAALPPSRSQPVRPVPKDSASMADRLREILADGNPMEHSRRILEFSATFQPDDWKLALMTLLDLGLDDPAPEFQITLTGWAAVDPLAAIRSLPAGPGYVLPVWLAADPEAALAWLNAPKQAAERDSLMFHVLEQRMAHDPAQAAQLILSMKSPESGIRACARALAKMPADAADRWVEKLPENLRTAARREMLNEIPPSRSAEGLKWLLNDPKLPPDASFGLFMKWSSLNDETAADALGHLAQGPIYDSAVDGITYAYSKRGDHDRALGLLDSLPAEQMQGRLSAWIDGSFRSAPAVFLGQVSRLDDPVARDQKYRTILPFWLKNDPAAAREWVANQDLPDSIRQEFTEK